MDTVSDSGELFVLPALHGLGTPYNDPEAVVLIQGESSSSSKGELAKAILEGIAFRMSEIVELSVESLGLESNSVLPIDGGLSRSDAFCQIQADLLGRPLVRHSIVEATVYGAAVAGGQGIGSDICGSSNQGDIFVQKSPASSIGDLLEAIRIITDSPDHNIDVIGTRHGEKRYESLLSREEMAYAIDMEDYYRIPPDLRDLNYAKYVFEGDKQISTLDDYTSHNTERLGVSEVKELLLELDFIKGA